MFLCAEYAIERTFASILLHVPLLLVRFVSNVQQHCYLMDHRDWVLWLLLWWLWLLLAGNDMIRGKTMRD